MIRKTPQPRTADKPVAPRKRATQQSRDISQTNEAKQPDIPLPSR